MPGKPLILQGARQVGKTHILTEFGRENFDRVYAFNFEERAELAGCFERSLEPARIIAKLEILLEEKIDPARSLIIFDEVQECPAALTSLKYFCEEAPQYRIACAGSLLGMALGAGVSFPVGKVSFLKLFPLGFSEFLRALGKEALAGFLTGLGARDRPEAVFHEDLMELFRLYMFLGGMPEAVECYARTGDLPAARRIQGEIMRSCSQDFGKHVSAAEALKIRRIWESVPAQLSKENKKFMFSAVARSARGREYETALQWLADAGLLLKSSRCEHPQAPLAAAASPDAFKVFLHDAGLLGAMTGLSPRVLLDPGELFVQFRGALFENMAAQCLNAAFERPLCYWASGNQAEIDFLIEHGGRVIPLEVKSGLNLRSRSLQSYIQRYRPPLSVRVSLKGMSFAEKVLDLPVYMLGELPRILDDLLN